MRPEEFFKVYGKTIAYALFIVVGYLIIDIVCEAYKKASIADIKTDILGCNDMALLKRIEALEKKGGA